MDITMCLSEKCPKRDMCLRSRARPNPLWQSYSNFEGFCLKENKFTYFLEDFREKNETIISLGGESMKVTLFSTHCPRCVVLEKKLQQKGIKYEEVNDVDVMMSKGYLSVPILEVDGEAMDFASANNWINNN